MKPCGREAFAKGQAPLLHAHCVDRSWFPTKKKPPARVFVLSAWLGEMGLAHLHVVEGHCTAARRHGADAFDVPALRAACGGTCLANNGYDRQRALDATATGHADMIAFGKSFIGNPDPVEPLRKDAPRFDAPATGYYGGGAEGYTGFTRAQAAPSPPACIARSPSCP